MHPTKRPQNAWSQLPITNKWFLFFLTETESNKTKQCHKRGKVKIIKFYQGFPIFPSLKSESIHKACWTLNIELDNLGNIVVQEFATADLLNGLSNKSSSWKLWITDHLLKGALCILLQKNDSVFLLTTFFWTVRDMKLIKDGSTRIIFTNDKLINHIGQ